MSDQFPLTSAERQKQFSSMLQLSTYQMRWLEFERLQLEAIKHGMMLAAGILRNSEGYNRRMEVNQILTAAKEFKL